MNSTEGSYVIAGFYKRAMAQLKETGAVSMIGEIFNAVQNDLNEETQMPVFQWNNDTANVCFHKKPKHTQPKGGGEGRTKDATVVVLDDDDEDGGDAQIVDGGAVDDGIRVVYGDDDDEQKYSDAKGMADAASDDDENVLEDVLEDVLDDVADEKVPAMEMVPTNSRIAGAPAAAPSENAWQQWSVAEVSAWIVSLDPVIYAQYEMEMVRVMAEEDVDGETLRFVDVADLKRWGIVRLKHSKPILMRIQKLIAQ